MRRLHDLSHVQYTYLRSIPPPPPLLPSAGSPGMNRLVAWQYLDYKEYLKWGDAGEAEVELFFTQMLYYALLLNSFIPISLYVSMNFVRFLQSWFMNQVGKPREYTNKLDLIARLSERVYDWCNISLTR